MLKIINRQVNLGHEPIIPILRSRLDAFVAKHARAPEAWLLGPKEFLKLHEEIARNTGVKRSKLTAVVGLNFLGMPVFPKTGPGIDIVIPGQLIALYCIAEAQKAKKGGPDAPTR